MHYELLHAKRRETGYDKTTYQPIAIILARNLFE